MIKRYFTRFLFCILMNTIFCLLVKSQVVGLWEVQEVKVGKEIMTPVAKWFDFEKEGNYRSGNGWLQNMAGQYKYDAPSSTLNQTIGAQPDEYGPFKVLVENENAMTWQRKEEGQQVEVRLKRIEQLPLAPWDQIVGNWALEEIQIDGKNKSSDYFTSGPPNFFFRWDRLFFIRGDIKRQTAGIWYIHPHRSELRLISNQGDKNDTQWNIAFMESDQKMLWRRTIDDQEEVWFFTKG